MKFIDNLLDKWSRFCSWILPVLYVIWDVLLQLGAAFKVVFRHLAKLRKVFLAIPIGWAAVMLALQNLQRLPEEVGLNLQMNGEFSIVIARELAVLGPVAVTALCLLLMFCSRRTLTPWFVSAVSLVLPIAIWIFNTFPS